MQLDGWLNSQDHSGLCGYEFKSNLNLTLNDHVISDTSYCIFTGGARTSSDWRRKLPNWMWEEAGEGSGHQDPFPHPSVQEVNFTTAGNPGVEQALQPLVTNMLVLQDMHGIYSAVLTYMPYKFITCTWI